MRNQSIYSVLSKQKPYTSIEEIIDLEFLDDMEKSSRRNRGTMAWLAAGIMVFYLLIATMGLLLFSRGNIRFVESASAQEYTLDQESISSSDFVLDMEPVTDSVEMEPIS